MNTIEKNKVIADFCGLHLNWNKCNHNLDPVEYELEITCPDFLDHDKDLMYLYDEEVPDECFKFDSDWNWLMPILEKIERIKYDDNDDSDEIWNYGYIRTFAYHHGREIHQVRINRCNLVENESRILAVHEAVYKFIIMKQTQAGGV